MALQVLFECSGLGFIAKGSGNFDLPRSVCLGAWRLSPVVFVKSRLQALCQADVVALWFDSASKDVDVVESYILLRRSMPTFSTDCNPDVTPESN